MEIFTYGNGNCSQDWSDWSSDSESSDWGSLSSWSTSESSNKNFDFSIGQECPTTPASSGTIFKLDTCLPYSFSPTIFKAYGNDIAKLTFSDDDYTCKGDSITHIIKSSECYGGCKQGFLIKAQFALSQDLYIPTNTLVGATYTGKCNGNYKDSFVSIEYQFLNNCTVGPGMGALVAAELTCNSKTNTEKMYRDDKCSPSELIYSMKNENEKWCREHYNFITICNQPKK
ncbi:hypothetical protein ACTFIV_001627 [Dictyostelium citrinum]